MQNSIVVIIYRVFRKGVLNLKNKNTNKRSDTNAIGTCTKKGGGLEEPGTSF